jgi:hypothetical protein
MVEAAESALALVTGGTSSTLRALQTLVERNSAARDLAPITSETLAQHARCVAVLQRLHGIGAAAAAGLQEALLLNQQQQQDGQQEHGAEQQQQQQRRLLELLLQHMSPALQGVKEELHELGQVRHSSRGAASVVMFPLLPLLLPLLFVFGVAVAPVSAKAAASMSAFMELFSPVDTAAFCG